MKKNFQASSFKIYSAYSVPDWLHVKKWFTVERHRATAKHQKYISILKEEKAGKDKDKLKKQTFFQPAAKKSFTEKLVQAFMAELFADLGWSVPSEPSCRNYVESSTESETERLRQLFENKNAFVVIDETELNEVKYVNVLIGGIAVPEKPYLLDCAEGGSWNCKSASDCGKNWRRTSKYQHPKQQAVWRQRLQH